MQRILVIDDDAGIAGLIRTLVSRFRRGGFAVVHAPDYPAGLRQLLHESFAVCLLDFHLGASTGLQLLQAAREHGCLTPVIMLTGDNRIEADLDALDHGALDFMEKAELNSRSLERAVTYAIKTAHVLAQLQQLATRDALTGLCNRRAFDARLREEWLRSTRFRRPFALLMLDVDRFKAINDAHGHPAGDAVLRHLAEILGGQFRAVDGLARFGGDEFAVILVETDEVAAQTAAECLRARVAASPCHVPGQPHPLTLSISVGAAVCRGESFSTGELLAEADAALYAQKRQRRSAVAA